MTRPVGVQLAMFVVCCLLMATACSRESPAEHAVDSGSVFRVAKAVRGDVLIVESFGYGHIEVTVALLGVSVRDEEMNQRAITYLNDNVVGKDVYLQTNFEGATVPGEADALAYVFLLPDRTMVNTEMLKLKLVEPDKAKGDPKRYQQEFRKAAQGK